MKINNQAKDELRKAIEEQLQNVPTGKRVVLDKELLDELIFFKGIDQEGKMFKIPIWTGEFLKKIDLSELSFENVWFITGGRLETPYKNIKLYEKDATELNLPLAHKIDFSGTNINIDFSELYSKDIEGTNFAGIDLSNSNFESVGIVVNSSFANTNIRIDFTLNSDNHFFDEVDFSDNDFSNISLNSDNIFDYCHLTYDEWYHALCNDDFSKDSEFKFKRCNFSNTGIKINYAQRRLDDLKYVTKELGSKIRDGSFSGCYINGKRIQTPEEKLMVSQEKKAEYEKFKEDIILSTLNNIKQQANDFKESKTTNKFFWQR